MAVWKQACLWSIRLVGIGFALWKAYRIRLHAVEDFGRVIHEFDPWFNYRAAEYLAAHGREGFFKWFDYSAWYPLGRPVGTTIYPGMQFVAVWIWQALKLVDSMAMSLNDVCVFVPAWFGVLTTGFLGLLAGECSGSLDAGIVAAAIMSMLPAHLMRSVAGAFDNECVAMCFFCAALYFWCRSLRTPRSCWWGGLAAVAYFAMVASWGGYVYVVNLIGAHATVLVLIDGFSVGVWLSYTLFYAIGTCLAIQVPVVGLTPMRSLEQMGPAVVFLWLQGLAICRLVKKLLSLDPKSFERFQFFALTACGAIVTLGAALLFQRGYFGPVSARVRGLFVPHTRTGNPLVDSVAEHQATSPRAYWQFFHYTCYASPIGFVMLIVRGFKGRASPAAALFLILYSAITYYFSSKMNRLVLLLGPAAAALSGVAIAGFVTWALGEVGDLFHFEPDAPNKPPPELDAPKAKEKSKSKAKPKPKPVAKPAPESVLEVLGEMWEVVYELWDDAGDLRMILALLVFPVFLWGFGDFIKYCDMIAIVLSTPDIIVRERVENGSYIILDDYREAYWWLRDNTPEDSRVMAWWDYGYQINGVANRTTIADGNTWNHEHIALLGRCLTGPEEESHRIVRHLADYVLVWANSRGDDLAKSPHMARIATSVYKDACLGDELCTQFGFDKDGKPTVMMEASLLYRLHSHEKKEGVRANPDLFEEAYTSKNGLVRIFRVLNISSTSKAWGSSAASRRCDAEGSWYCPGSYPPELEAMIAEKRRAFRQLEDFNAPAEE